VKPVFELGVKCMTQDRLDEINDEIGKTHPDLMLEILRYIRMLERVNRELFKQR
jgi:hypothetical protein